MPLSNLNIHCTDIFSIALISYKYCISVEVGHHTIRYRSIKENKLFKWIYAKQLGRDD